MHMHVPSNNGGKFHVKRHTKSQNENHMKFIITLRDKESQSLEINDEKDVHQNFRTSF